MGSSGITCEIVDTKDEPDVVHVRDRSNVLSFKLKAKATDGRPRSYPVDDELNQLIKSIDLKASPRYVGPSMQGGTFIARRSALKRPVKIGISQASGIGISESVTLKQALRKLCISQASEVAATKRLSKPNGVSGVPVTGAVKRLYASVVVQPKDSGLMLDEERENLVEISVVPEIVSIDSSEKASELPKPCIVDPSKKTTVSSPYCNFSTKTRVLKTSIQDAINTESADLEGNSSAETKVETEDRVTSITCISSCNTVAEAGKSSTSPQLRGPEFRCKTAKGKGKWEATMEPNYASNYSEISRIGAVPSKTKVVLQKKSISPVPRSSSPNSEVRKVNKVRARPEPSLTPDSDRGEACKTNKDNAQPKSNLTPVRGRAVCETTSESSRSREKGECTQSSKSSIGDYSCSTSISDESHRSGCGNSSRPHMSKDIRWIAIRHVAMQHGSLGLKNFKLLKRLGCGDIGTVYLAELIGSECLFALKVMDIDYLVSRKKMQRAQTEREILQMLDHPFLPTLYAYFTSDNLSCLVMEYCPGGDLHVLRQRQTGRSFSEPAARFYVAEVLLALEYLHMLGVVYRDLKPENILVREDGHIMLSDFDLSLRCTVNPTLLKSSSLGTQEPVKKLSGPCAENSCIDPLCLQPSWVHVSCFSPHLISSGTAKDRKMKSDIGGQVTPLPQLVVEPTEARSNSFVGTHEYLAPEIIRGDGHGSAVDWWTFGIFLYELLFGRTPFKGPGNEETLANVVSQSLKFPESPSASFHARDLIRGLLIKEPECRLGSVRGAAEIKQHSFFEGLNWALIRCAAPPETPRSHDVAVPTDMSKKKEGKCLDFRTNGEDVQFELF